MPMIFTLTVISILFLIFLKWMAFAAAAGLTLLSAAIAIRKGSARALSLNLIASAGLIVALCYIPGVEHYRMYGIQTEVSRSAKIIELSMLLSLVAAMLQPVHSRWISGAAVV